jgi:hypothetical protein
MLQQIIRTTRGKRRQSPFFFREKPFNQFQLNQRGYRSTFSPDSEQAGLVAHSPLERFQVRQAEDELEERSALWQKILRSLQSILDKLPENHHVSFLNDFHNALDQVADSNELDHMRDVILNWMATAEIHATPGATRNLMEYIALDESDRASRMEEEAWDWRSEKDQFLANLT